MRLRAKLTLVTVGIVVLSVFLSTFLIIVFTKRNTEDTVITAGIEDFGSFYAALSNAVAYSGAELSAASLHSYLRYRFLSVSGSGGFALEQ